MDRYSTKNLFRSEWKRFGKKRFKRKKFKKKKFKRKKFRQRKFTFCKRKVLVKKKCVGRENLDNNIEFAIFLCLQV